MDADEAAKLIDEIYARIEKIEELMARSSRMSGGRVDFMQAVLIEEVYDRLSRLRRLIAESTPCR
ncbi:hypothetical protein [Stetteria hydrogenophila]